MCNSGLLPVWPQLSSATGKGEVTVGWGGGGGGERRWLNHNRWANEPWTIKTVAKCLIRLILFPCCKLPRAKNKMHSSTMWPFRKTQFWVVAAAANASLWTQLCIKQTPTYPRQRTDSPLIAARILQNRFTFCCPALLWPGKRGFEATESFQWKMWLWQKCFFFRIARRRTRLYEVLSVWDERSAQYRRAWSRR